MRHNLAQLRDELTQAGIAVPALGSYTDASGVLVLHSYDAVGNIVPLSAEATAVILAHEAQPTTRDADLATVRASNDLTIQALVRLLGLGV